MAKTTSKNPLTFVVEHLDPELGPWSALEYDCIAQESKVTQTRFLLTSVPEALKLPGYLAQVDSLEVEHRSVEEIFSDRKSKVCLLDPAARVELSPVDGEQFEIFLFGGILGMYNYSTLPFAAMCKYREILLGTMFGTCATTRARIAKSDVILA